MRWLTHQAGALAAALACNMEPRLMAGMVLGAVLPDLAEHAISRGNKRIFFRIHRGVLHWFGLYLAGFAPVLMAPLAPDAANLLLGLLLGACSHLLLDGLNPGGVPLLPFRSRPRLRLNLIATGSPGEWFLLAAFFAAIALCGHRLDPSWLRRLERML
jgi:inner membrane protein